MSHSESSIQPVLYTDDGDGSFLSKNVYYHLYHLYWGHCSAFPLIHTSLSLKTFCILASELHSYSSQATISPEASPDLSGAASR